MTQAKSYAVGDALLLRDRSCIRLCLWRAVVRPPSDSIDGCRRPYHHSAANPGTSLSAWGQ